MYAVIASGGKQYRVTEGQILKLEKLAVEPNQTIQFDQVLMVADGDDINIGSPFMNGVKITGEVIRQGRHDKIRVIKFRRRKHHMKQMGHRQDFTEVKITAIDTGKPRKASAEKVTAEVKAKPKVKKATKKAASEE